MPFACSDDARIYYERRDSGPALLLVPGIPATSADWFPFADGLLERFTTIVYDNRGSGRSDAPVGPTRRRSSLVTPSRSSTRSEFSVRTYSVCRWAE